MDKWTNKGKEQNKSGDKKTIKVSLLFSLSSANDLWVTMIEKAYAKLNGGYFKIGSGGHGDEALFDLTGAPSERISLNSFKEMFEPIFLGEEDSKLKGKPPNFNKSDEEHRYIPQLPEILSLKIERLFRQLYWYSKFGYIMTASVKGSGYQPLTNGLRSGYGYLPL
jgi:hypothetical protein